MRSRSDLTFLHWVYVQPHWVVSIASGLSIWRGIAMTLPDLFVVVRYPETQSRCSVYKASRRDWKEMSSIYQRRLSLATHSLVNHSYWYFLDKGVSSGFSKHQRARKKFWSTDKPHRSGWIVNRWCRWQCPGWSQSLFRNTLCGLYGQICKEIRVCNVFSKYLSNLWPCSVGNQTLLLSRTKW